MRERDSEAAKRGRAFLLLPSKTSCPMAEPGTIRRHAAAEKLALILHHSVTSIIAPAGFGKTSAIASWAHECEWPVAWCSLDEDDADPARFWYVLQKALETADIQGIETFDPTEVNWADALAAREAIAELLVALSAQTTPLVLVLEDIHQVQNTPLVSETLSYFIRNLTPQLHLVTTSRTPISLSLAKIRARGQLLEINEKELRLSLEEQKLLFTTSCPTLTSESLATIAEITQGWPAGCRLIELKCRSVGTNTDLSEVLHDTREHIGDYLFEEVIEDLPSDLVNFLTDTSVVDSFDNSLAASITEDSPAESQSKLNRLVEGGVFIQQMESEEGRTWYRYHQMLLDLLRSRGRRVNEKRLQDCAARARDWFLQEGFDDTAVTLCFSIRDFEAICTILERRWKSLYMNDELEILLRWVALVPDAILDTKPFLCVAATLPYINAGDALRAHNLIQKALLQLGEDDEFLFAFCLTQQAFVASFEGRLHESGVIAEKALKYLPDEEQYLRGMMMQVASSALWAEDPIAAIQGYSEALPLHRSVGNANLLCSALCNLALFEAAVGHLGNAAHYAQEAINLYTPEEREGKPMLAFAHRALAECAYEHDNTQEFYQEQEAFDTLACHGVIPARSAEMHMLAAKEALRSGCNEQGINEFFNAVAIDEESALSMMPSMALVRAWTNRFHAKAAQRIKHTNPSQRLRFFDGLVGLCLGDPATPDTLANLATTVSESDFALRVRALTMAAVAAESIGRAQHALNFIREAYCFASDHGLMVAFLENSESLRPMVHLLRSSRQETDAIIARLIEETSAPATTVADTLTTRELDVLRLMADGATVAQAADTLVVSRETVKKHLGNIYTKLGVHSKMQAVALLRDEGIL